MWVHNQIIIWEQSEEENRWCLWMFIYKDGNLTGFDTPPKTLSTNMKRLIRRRNKNEWFWANCNNSLTWTVGPFWDDSSKINHDEPGEPGEQANRSWSNLPRWLDLANPSSGCPKSWSSGPKSMGKIHGMRTIGFQRKVRAHQGSRSSQSQSPMVMTNVSYLFPGSPPMFSKNLVPKNVSPFEKSHVFIVAKIMPWKYMKNPVSLAHKNTCSSSMEASWVMGLALSPPSCQGRIFHEININKTSIPFIYGKAESLKIGNKAKPKALSYYPLVMTNIAMV